MSVQVFTIREMPPSLITRKTRKFHKYYFTIISFFSTAPFHTTKDRTVGEALNSNPGAGSYASQERKIVPKV